MTFNREFYTYIHSIKLESDNPKALNILKIFKETSLNINNIPNNLLSLMQEKLIAHSDDGSISSDEFAQLHIIIIAIINHKNRINERIKWYNERLGTIPLLNMNYKNTTFNRFSLIIKNSSTIMWNNRLNNVLDTILIDGIKSPVVTTLILRIRRALEHVPLTIYNDPL